MQLGLLTPICDRNPLPDMAALSIFSALPPAVYPLAEFLSAERLSVFGWSASIEKLFRKSDQRISWMLIPRRHKMSVSMARSFGAERACLVGEIHKQSLDILHAHWTQFGHALAALDTGLPCVVTVHDAARECVWFNSVNLRPVDWFCNWKQVQMTREVFRRARHLTAVSPYVEQHVRRVFGFQGEVRVIPNAVPVGDETAVKRKMERGVNSSPVFISIGHWGRLKNIKNLIRAFAMVRDAVPASELILIGGGLGSVGSAEKWAAHRNLAGGIRFRGARPHQEVLQTLKEEADILVHPSRSEGFGMTLAEALANGVSVIANRAGAMPWALDEGRAGLLVDAESPNKLADAMIRVVRDGKTRKELTLYGYQMVRRRFDPEKIAQQHIEYYRDILQETSTAVRGGF